MIKACLHIYIGALYPFFPPDMHMSNIDVAKKDRRLLVATKNRMLYQTITTGIRPTILFIRPLSGQCQPIHLRSQERRWMMSPDWGSGEGLLILLTIQYMRNLSILHRKRMRWFEIISLFVSFHQPVLEPFQQCRRSTWQSCTVSHTWSMKANQGYVRYSIPTAKMHIRGICKIRLWFCRSVSTSRISLMAFWM